MKRKKSMSTCVELIVPPYIRRNANAKPLSRVTFLAYDKF